MNTKELQGIPVSTITLNRKKIEEPVGNIYEAISIIAQQADLVNSQMRNELLRKLNEYAFHGESLDEVFENREQIEISRHYESLPKATAIAIEQWLNGDVQYEKGS